MEDELVNDLWNNLTELSSNEKYEYIMAIAESIKHKGGKQFVRNMLYVLNDICRDNNICPECGNILDSKENCEIHNEVDDNNIEHIDYFYCSNCGWNNKME